MYSLGRTHVSPLKTCRWVSNTSSVAAVVRPAQELQAAGSHLSKVTRQMLWKISVITLEGCCSCSSAQGQFIATIYSKAWHTSVVVKSWREIITRRRIHDLLAEGRWLTVSIYRTSLPCRGGVPSLCVSPCLWREAFLAPVYTEGWKNLITHTLRNHNAHYAALTTFTCRLQV